MYARGHGEEQDKPIDQYHVPWRCVDKERGGTTTTESRIFSVGAEPRRSLAVPKNRRYTTNMPIGNLVPIGSTTDLLVIKINDQAGSPTGEAITLRICSVDVSEVAQHLRDSQGRFGLVRYEARSTMLVT